MKKTNKKPVLIVLNGVPCAGKSTLMKTFQDMSEEPFFSIGMDTFTDYVIPQKWYSAGKLDGILGHIQKNEEGKDVMEVYYGPVAQDLLTIMHGAIAIALRNRNNVIVDHLTFYPEWYDQLQQLTKEFDPIWVKVTLPFDELERREAIRKKSPISCARMYHERIHNNIPYTLTIDTSTVTPQEGAQLLFDYIGNRQT